MGDRDRPQINLLFRGVEMLTQDEFNAIIKEISYYSYDTDVTVNEDEHTYSPSETVCNVDDIKDILKRYTN